MDNQQSSQDRLGTTTNMNSGSRTIPTIGWMGSLKKADGTFTQPELLIDASKMIFVMKRRKYDKNKQHVEKMFNVVKTSKCKNGFRFCTRGNITYKLFIEQ